MYAARRFCCGLDAAVAVVLLFCESQPFFVSMNNVLARCDLKPKRLQQIRGFDPAIPPITTWRLDLAAF